MHPAIYFKNKLKDLKLEIKKWRINVVQHESTKLSDLKKKVDYIDLKAETSPLSSVEIENRTNIFKEIFEIERSNVQDLKQKSKIKWAIEGDENSKFFHGMINNKLRRSRINGLSINGTWVTDPFTIKEAIFKFYKDKFDNHNTSRPSFSSIRFKKLSTSDASSLEFPFSPEEIKETVWSCAGEKAPDPDGFTFKFFKYHWDTIGNDIMLFVKNFETSCFIPRGCNSSFFTLIPKKKRSPFYTRF